MNVHFWVKDRTLLALEGELQEQSMVAGMARWLVHYNNSRWEDF